MLTSPFVPALIFVLLLVKVLAELQTDKIRIMYQLQILLSIFYKPIVNEKIDETHNPNLIH